MVFKDLVMTRISSTGFLMMVFYQLLFRLMRIGSTSARSWRKNKDTWTGKVSHPGVRYPGGWRLDDTKCDPGLTGTHHTVSVVHSTVCIMAGCSCHGFEQWPVQCNTCYLVGSTLASDHNDSWSTKPSLLDWVVVPAQINTDASWHPPRTTSSGLSLKLIAYTSRFACLAFHSFGLITSYDRWTLSAVLSGGILETISQGLETITRLGKPHKILSIRASAAW